MSQKKSTNITLKMEKFHFYFDQKATCWNRTIFNVEAENYEEAKTKAIEIVKSGKVSEYSWEPIFETTELMSKEENGGQPTEELYSTEEHPVIYEN